MTIIEKYLEKTRKDEQRVENTLCTERYKAGKNVYHLVMKHTHLIHIPVINYETS